MSRARDPGAVTRRGAEARLAARLVVDYCWSDELEDFVAHPDASHVFRSLVVLESWLSGDRRTPEEYAAEVRHGGRRWRRPDGPGLPLGDHR